MFPQYSKNILQYHVLKLVEQGYSRAEIAKRVNINLARLFKDNVYFKSKAGDSYKIVKLLHETDYHEKRELPDTLSVVQKPASFNAYLLNSKNALDMFDKLVAFNSACSPSNDYGWCYAGQKVEFYIRQCPKEKTYSTTQGMIFYVVLMIKQLLGEGIDIEAGASSSTYPDVDTFIQHGTKNISFNQSRSYIRLNKLKAEAQNLAYNHNVSQYLKNQFQRQFKVEEAEPGLSSLIISDIQDAIRGGHDTRFYNVDFISARLGLSRSTLYRKLQLVGTSFSEIVDTFRKEESIRMLKSGFLTLEEISEILGYSNLTAFNRAFRRWHNTSPANYRNHS